MGGCSREKQVSLFYLAGELDRLKEKSFLVKEARFDHPLIQQINSDLFGKRQRKRQTSELTQETKNRLKDSLYEYVKIFDIHLIIAENGLSIPMNIPLGMALFTPDFLASLVTRISLMVSIT